MLMDLKNKKILLTGGGGFLGSHVAEKLFTRGAAKENITIPRAKELDLRIKANCEKAVRGQEVVIHLAANVGGIGYNQEKPGDLFYDNIIMGTYLMDAAYRAGAEKYLGLATICSYPKFTPVPFREEELWNGYPEETNAPYGLAKKALTIQAQAYRAQYGWNAVFLLPVNLYGPRDSFDVARSHVIPALIRKVHDAKTSGRSYVEVWGTGRATREFLFVEDAAEGIVLALERYDKSDPVNLGAGMEISVRDLAEKICALMDYRGEIRWDASRPDGQPRRRLDISRAEREFGFRARTDLETGLKKTIAWYVARAG